jgi:RNA polymerase sigma factor (sigma-70 family)
MGLLGDGATATPVVADGADVARLFDRYAGHIYRYCVRRVGVSAAEDLVGEVFLIAHRRRDRIGDLDTALPWLYGVATNLLRRHRRAEARGYRALARTGTDPLGGWTDVEEGPETRGAERADASVAIRRVAAELARLPRRQRDVLLLFAVAELSYAEIAEALGIPVGSVQSALHRARIRMRSALSEGEQR